MNVQVQMTATPTPCVPTLKDHMFVAASKVSRVMEGTAQVMAGFGKFGGSH